MNLESIEEKANDNNFETIEKKLDGIAFKKGNLIVILSKNKKKDNKLWWHLSMSRPNKYIPYEEICYVKDIFFGDVKALWIFPEKKYYVNIHKYCFHLFYCEDGYIIPEFSLNGISI